ncbi:hypothetical protein FHX42_004600 [Saccharopolyspora lacisalsi]|uniref:DUF397 domain-containing protein n=1 Tax=Halosaccharopolyspora lacisalsi TaxID=1000566 RepID=A0A839E3R1_9PSEU|nr:DUF397 domain-containing protein [Halosaccharopolyspora lacisalsi]MBA8827216.1 hypothetical protein [Halosaccharopolyspora lacisalsi]
MTDLSRADWRKSTRSSEQGQCVEVARNLDGVAAVRDSKTPHRAALTFTPERFAVFLSALKAGGY